MKQTGWLFVFAAVISVGLIFGWYLTRPTVIELPQSPVYYMAEGHREIELASPRNRFSVGDTLQVLYHFETTDTAWNDKVFASILIDVDTEIVIAEEVLLASPGVKMTTTHLFDTGPIARGWTFSDLTIGDTLTLDVLLYFGHPRDTTTFMAAMDSDRRDSVLIKKQISIH